MYLVLSLFQAAPAKKSSWWSSSKKKATGLSDEQLAMIYETINFDPTAPATAVTLTPDYPKTSVQLTICAGSFSFKNNGPLASMEFEDFSTELTLREGSMSANVRLDSLNMHDQ
eukprot:SAG22_NODE_5188_length_1067_cov_1.628099_1_plen_113_part_10